MHFFFCPKSSKEPDIYNFKSEKCMENMVSDKVLINYVFSSEILVLYHLKQPFDIYLDRKLVALVTS